MSPVGVVPAWLPVCQEVLYSSCLFFWFPKVGIQETGSSVCYCRFRTVLVGRGLRSCGCFDCQPKSGSDMRLEKVALVLHTSKHGDWMQGTLPLLMRDSIMFPFSVSRKERWAGKGFAVSIWHYIASHFQILIRNLRLRTFKENVFLP